MSTGETTSETVGDADSWTTAPAGPQMDAVSREAPVPPGGAPSVPEITPGSAEGADEAPEEPPEGDLADSAATPADAVVETPD